MGDRLAGRVATITGGASGIGEATARRFVAEGARVVIADLQVDLGQQVTASLGDAARFVRCDVTVEEQVAAAVALAVDTWGRLDVMFNNAGIVGAVGPITETEAAGWLKSIDVLLNSVFYGAKHAARVMIPQHSGSIISTTSIAGLVGGLGPHAYTAAKAGVIGLTKSLAAELQQHGVRANAIAPGTIPTALTAQSHSGNRHDLSAITARVKESTGPYITATVADIAAAALYLASDDAQLVNGHTLVVDAGRSVNGGSSRFVSARPDLVGVDPAD